MKTTTELFDFVLLLFILALMLPFIFGSISPLTDIQMWGFMPSGDKTAKRYSGDVYTPQAPSESSDAQAALRERMARE